MPFKDSDFEDGPTDVLAKCGACGNWFCLRTSGSYECRECGVAGGDHHLADWIEISSILNVRADGIF
jgi:hypothetical protein